MEDMMRPGEEPFDRSHEDERAYERQEREERASMRDAAAARDAAVVNQERGRIMHLIENIRHDWRMNGQKKEVDTCDYIISAIKESWKGYAR
jgi:hypothetical protein